MSPLGQNPKFLHVLIREIAKLGNRERSRGVLFEQFIIISISQSKLIAENAKLCLYDQGKKDLNLILLNKDYFTI
jgi:hypothetical protein